MKKITGVYSAMMTPFDSQGKVDEKKTKKLVELLIEKGVDGIFPISSIGESVTLDFEESKKLLQYTIEQCKGRVKIVPGASSSNVKATKKLMKCAEEFGCEYVVVSPPYYYPNTQEGLVEFYKEITIDSKVKVIVYNIPLFSTPISPLCFEELLKNKNIVGIKDSSGNAIDFMAFKCKIDESGRKDFSLFVGREEFFLGALFLGADGCMVGTAGIFPEVLVAINKLYKDGNIEKAMAIQKKIVPLVQLFFSLPFPCGFKIGLELRGIEMGKLMKPLSKKESEKYVELKNKIESLLEDIINSVN